nr:LTA synthase family protein [Lacticaseibacillus zhaodongensis]
MAKKLQAFAQKRIGFLTILLLLIWVKTIYAYLFDFSLGAENILQYFILLINPLGTSILLLSIAMYVHNSKRAYITGLIIYTALTVLLLANVLYYREFTDFLTVNTILSVGKVAQGLGKNSASMFQPRDLVFLLDYIVVLTIYVIAGIKNIIAFLNHKQVRWPGPHFAKPSANTTTQPPHLPLATTVLGVALLTLTMAVSELNRPQLLTRTFDRAFIVKYLGLAPFTVYDGFKTAQTSQVRAQASSADMAKVLQYTQKKYAAPNMEYYGAAKGKNVIIIHLESFQQFLIGQKIDGQEVTPFLNSLVKNKNALSFDNFFNQVGLGKTSDAENMLETSTFGITSGSLFANVGSDNTFQGAPAILNQRAGYSTAALHGGVGSFWNRDGAYKSLGYQYFFDNDYFQHSTEMNTEYGIKDKLMLGESARYLEHLQQPFYAKIITTSNHFPFTIDDEDSSFPDAGTNDVTVNDYFKTANYLDSALKEFFAYLKKSGLAKNSLVMLYGDHYGIADDRYKNMAQLVGKNPKKWNDFDDAQMQRVPLIFYSPGLKGGVNNTYGGEIDVLPTLLHLLGISTNNYVQFGTDLLSDAHSSVVAQRNHDFITPEYTVIGGEAYLNANGERISPDLETRMMLKADQKQVNTELRLSDSIANRNLLRFYTPQGFTPVNTKEIDYSNSLQRLLQTEAHPGSTSLYSQRKDKSTVPLYSTDAPEIKGDSSILSEFPEAVGKQLRGTDEAGNTDAKNSEADVTSSSTSSSKSSSSK